MACCYAVLATLAAPAALGPALGPVLRALGAQETHLCKCGMKPGKCGCPDCARLEHERQLAHRQGAVPALGSHCDDDEATIVFGALPVAAVASSTVTIPAASRERVAALSSPLPPALRDLDPPTPPPRLLAA